MYEFMEKSKAADTRGIFSNKKRDIQNKKTHPDMAERTPYKRRGFLGQREINNSMQDKFPGPPVIQFTREEDIEKIIRICSDHHITLTHEEAAHILDAIDANPDNPVRILNHNRTITRWLGTFRTQECRFSGMGPMGRTRPGGASVIMEDAPPPDEWVAPYKMEATIDRSALSGIKKRGNLNKVMGGSAFQQSKLLNAEYLHKKPHQLGGTDEPENLMIGCHALNTAMIPIENFVHTLVQQGIQVNYTVGFEPRVGHAIWTQTANIAISMEIAGERLSYSMRFSVSSTAYISNESYSQIVSKVREMEQDIDNIMHIQYKV